MNTRWKLQLGNLPTYPAEPFYSGRGIVIVSAVKYLTSALTTISMLRFHECKLPVELWLDENDFVPQILSLLLPLHQVVLNLGTLLLHPVRKLPNLHLSPVENFFQLSDFLLVNVQ